MQKKGISRTGKEIQISKVEEEDRFEEILVINPTSAVSLTDNTHSKPSEQTNKLKLSSEPKTSQTEDDAEELHKVFQYVRDNNMELLLKLVNFYSIKGVINITDNRHQSLLHIATLSGHYNMVEYLVKNGLFFTLKIYLKYFFLIKSILQG